MQFGHGRCGTRGRQRPIARWYAIADPDGAACTLLSTSDDERGRMRRFTWLAAVLLLTGCTQPAPDVDTTSAAPSLPALDAQYTTLTGGEPPAGSPLIMAKKMTAPDQSQLIGPTYTVGSTGRPS
jgi:hypothetical protein